MASAARPKKGSEQRETGTGRSDRRSARTKLASDARRPTAVSGIQIQQLRGNPPRPACPWKFIRSGCITASQQQSRGFVVNYLACELPLHIGHFDTHLPERSSQPPKSFGLRRGVLKNLCLRKSEGNRLQLPERLLASTATPAWAGATAEMEVAEHLKNHLLRQLHRLPRPAIIALVEPSNFKSNWLKTAQVQTTSWLVP